MTQNLSPAAVANESGPSEALSNEVLKLKIDDLFQEVENLKRRMERLESQANLMAGGIRSSGS